MSFAQSWDFTPGVRVVLDDMRQCSREYEWLEEPHVSPDGERVAMVAALPDPALSVAVNGEVWEATFEKVWYPRFSPDGRLTDKELSALSIDPSTARRQSRRRWLRSHAVTAWGPRP